MTKLKPSNKEKDEEDDDDDYDDDSSSRGIFPTLKFFSIINNFCKIITTIQ